MVSVWGEECQECKSQKSKLILFDDILLNEISDDINGYLCCNDCSKMLKVINDPIYKTLNEKQQKIFKFVRLFPFPKSIKALKGEFFCMSYAIRLNGQNLNRLNKNIFSIIKFVYENLFVDWRRQKGIMKDLLTKTVEEMNKRKRNKVNKADAFIYIRDIIQDLEDIYQWKSRAGSRIFEKNRTSKDYDYPSFRKYIGFYMGNSRGCLYHMIHNHLQKGFR